MINRLKVSKEIQKDVIDERLSLYKNNKAEVIIYAKRMLTAAEGF
jgi:hypothetical protein